MNGSIITAGAENRHSWPNGKKYGLKSDREFNKRSLSLCYLSILVIMNGSNNGNVLTTLKLEKMQMRCRREKSLFVNGEFWTPMRPITTKAIATEL